MATPGLNRFQRPKPALFGTWMRKQKTISYPEAQPRGQPAVTTAKVRALTWSPLGGQIATTGNRSVKIWDPEKNKAPVHEFVFRGEQAEKVLYHPLGEPEVATVGEDGMVRFFDVRSKAASGEIKAGGSCFTLAWSPDGAEMVVGKKNDDLVRIDRASRSIISTTRRKEQTNQTIFNHVGDTLLTTTTEGYFLLLSYPDFTELARFPAHSSAINCIAYHPAGAYVATGAQDGIISLYRTNGWLPARTFDVQGPVKTVSFSYDGCWVVAGSEEGNYFDIYNVESGESPHKVETKVPSPVVAWSPNNYAFAYTSADWGFRVAALPTPT